jgi:serine/threonine-protein kinase
MDEPESVLVPGYKLDRYELLCPIASGGMATVWLARLRGKRGFEKLFAVKMIKSEHTADPRFQEMFLDEARIASAIEHPNVAQILDLGETDGLLYTVMEWVDGESLAKLSRLAQKRGSPMPLHIALRIMADACAGLHAAHELRDEKDVRLGVVHRDVSPQNILVTSGGAVKVIDFGVAKAVNRRGEGTQSGVVKGKIRYLAPEQVGSGAKNVDHRADIWAVGICLYELVMGKPPYDELNDIDVIRKLMGDDPLPNLAGTPDELAPLFASTISRDPEGRFATAAALRRAIEATLDGMNVSVTTDDVADFLKDKLPDIAKKRRSTVQKAVEEAKDRKKEDAPVSGESGKLPADDVAFAPTIASAPKAKKPDLHARDEHSGPKTTAGATLTDQVGERRSSVFPWLFAMLIVGGAGASIWYANQRWHESLAPAATQPPPKPAVSQPPPPEASAPSPAMSVSSPVSVAVDPPPVPSGGPSAGRPRHLRFGPFAPPSASASAAPDAGRPKWNPRGDDTAEPPPAPTSTELVP